MTGAPTRRGALWSLVKPRIVALLCLTGVTGLVAAGGRDPVVIVGFTLAGACTAAGAAALNCYYDRDLDREMERTADRPLPRGDLDPRAALAFAVGLLVVGTGVGLATLPPTAVGFMWLGVAAYVGLYTVLLKRRHWLGVVLGGSAGSFPVLAGWSAARPLAPVAVGMAALVFVWTPAHAWALAAVYRDDFAAAGVPTLPAVATAATVQDAVWYGALATVGLAVALVSFAGRLYAVGVLVASPLFLLAYADYRRRGTDATAVRAFFTSNCYLAVCCLAWAADGAFGTVHPAGLAVWAALVVAAFWRLWVARPALRGVPAAPPTPVTTVARRVAARRRNWLPTSDRPDSPP